MLINEWGKCSLNGIAVISRTIFVENWLWRPSSFSEIAEIQHQPSLTLYPYKKFGDDIFITFPLIDRTSSKCWEFASSVKAAILFQFDRSKKQKTSKVLWLLTCTSSQFWVSRKLAVAAILFFRNCWKSIPAKLMPPYIHIQRLVKIYS